MDARLQEGKYVLEEAINLYVRKKSLEHIIEKNKKDMDIMNGLLVKQQEERAQCVVIVPAMEAH